MLLWFGMVKCYSNMDAMMANLQRAELSICDGRQGGLDRKREPINGFD
jgi:hypothetical protein